MGGGEVLLGPLLYLGWGRCGLLGEGSKVVKLWENLLLWISPGDLDVPWTFVVFFVKGGWGVLIFWIFPGVVAARGMWLLVGLGSLPSSTSISMVLWVV